MLQKLLQTVLNCWAGQVIFEYEEEYADQLITTNVYQTSRNLIS